MALVLKKQIFMPGGTFAFLLTNKIPCILCAAVVKCPQKVLLTLSERGIRGEDHLVPRDFISTWLRMLKVLHVGIRGHFVNGQ